MIYLKFFKHTIIRNCNDKRFIISIILCVIFIILNWNIKNKDVFLFNFNTTILLLILIFIHIDKMWGFINLPYNLEFLLSFPFKENYLIIVYHISNVLMFFIYILFIQIFGFLKGVTNENVIINNLIFVTIFQNILLLFSLLKYLHFPVFGFILSFYIGGFLRNGFSEKGYLNYLSIILPPFNSVLMYGLKIYDFISVLLYMTIPFLILVSKRNFSEIKKI